MFIIIIILSFYYIFPTIVSTYLAYVTEKEIYLIDIEGIENNLETIEMIFEEDLFRVRYECVVLPREDNIKLIHNRAMFSVARGYNEHS